MMYTVKLNLNHDGKEYTPGDEVELDEQAAAILVKDGVVEAPESEDSTSEDTDEDTSEDADLESMTLAQLKEEAATRGLPVSGTKAELIERITAANGDDL